MRAQVEDSIPALNGNHALCHESCLNVVPARVPLVSQSAGVPAASLGRMLRTHCLCQWRTCMHTRSGCNTMAVRSGRYVYGDDCAALRDDTWRLIDAHNQKPNLGERTAEPWHAATDLNAQAVALHHHRLRRPWRGCWGRSNRRLRKWRSRRWTSCVADQGREVQPMPGPRRGLKGEAASVTARSSSATPPPPPWCAGASTAPSNTLARRTRAYHAGTSRPAMR